MNDEKRRRIIAAITVNAVILIFIIVSVIIYQIVQICVLSARRRELLEELEYCNREYEASKELENALTSEEDKDALIQAIIGQYQFTQNR